MRFITELDHPGHAGRALVHLKGLDAAAAAPGVQLARLHLRPGQVLPTLDSSTARFGAVLACGADAPQAHARAEAAARCIQLAW